MKIDWSRPTPKPSMPIPEGCTCQWELAFIAGGDYVVRTAPECIIHGWKVPKDKDEWHSPT